MSNLIIGLDTETTGLDVTKGHRIIEFCGHVYRWPERKKVISVTQRISNEGQKIDRKAQEVHGISQADLIGKPRFKEFAKKIAPVFARKPLVVAHNIEFDIKFLAAQMAEVGHPLPPDLMLFDTMGEGMTASYDSKPPSLREFCWAMGVEYDPSKAHAAEYDVDVMMEALFAGIDRGYIRLPEQFDTDMEQAA